MERRSGTDPGVRIVVTRPEEQSEQLAARLREIGHEVAICPLIAVESLGDGPVELAGYDWVVVTSANGARELARRASGDWPRVAAIGPGTAEALTELQVAVDLVPATSTQEGLVEELASLPGRVLFAGAESARRLLVEELGADFVPLYRTRELQPDPPPHGDLVVLASPSAARALAGLWNGAPVISIGPQTTLEARSLGLTVVGEAREQSVEGLVEAVTAAAGHD